MKGILKQSIMWLKDTGVLDRVKDDAWNPPILIPDPILRNNQPLILKQMGLMFIILVAGHLIGTIIFLVELFMEPKLNNTSKTVNGAAMPTTPLIRALVIIDSNKEISPEPRKMSVQG